MSGGYIDLDGAGDRAPTAAELRAVQAALWLGSRRRKNTIAVFGDSISAQNSAAGITNAKGIFSQARAIAENRFYFDHALNFGVSGNTSAQALARLQTVLDAQPARIAAMIGTNDFANGIAKEDTIINWLAILNMADLAGIPVDIMPVLPRTYDNDVGGANLAALRAHRGWVNAMLRAIAADRGPALGGFIPVDEALTNKGSATGDPIALAMSAEAIGNLGRLHPLGYGAQVAGIVVADYYSKIYPLPPRRIHSAGDLYNSGAGNPLGVMNANPMMQGGTGTVGTGVSNTGTTGVATNYTAARTSGSSMAATMSKEAITDPTGGEKQVITLSGGGAGANNEVIEFSRVGNLATTGLSVGQKVKLVCKFEQSGLINVANIKAQLTSTVSGAVIGLGGSGITGDREYPNLIREIESPEIIITSPGIEVLGSKLVIQGDCSAATGGALSGLMKILHFAVEPS